MANLINGYNGEALKRYKDITCNKRSIVFYRLYFNANLNALWYSYCDGNKKDGFYETLCVIKFENKENELKLNEYILTDEGNLRFIKTLWSKKLIEFKDKGYSSKDLEYFKSMIYEDLLNHNAKDELDEVVEDLYNSLEVA